MCLGYFCCLCTTDVAGRSWQGTLQESGLETRPDWPLRFSQIRWKSSSIPLPQLPWSRAESYWKCSVCFRPLDKNSWPRPCANVWWQMLRADYETEDWQQSVCEGLPGFGSTRQRTWQVFNVCITSWILIISTYLIFSHTAKRKIDICDFFNLHSQELT